MQGQSQCTNKEVWNCSCMYYLKIFKNPCSLSWAFISLHIVLTHSYYKYGRVVMMWIELLGFVLVTKVINRK